jgi:hypothetical protein
MQAAEHFIIGGQANDARWAAERLGLADFCEVRCEIGSADRARWHCRYGVGHDPDDAAEPSAVEGMALLEE